MPKHMKFKCLEEIEYMNFKKMFINFKNQATVALFLLYEGKEEIHNYMQSEVNMTVWAGQQIKEKYQNGCHSKTTRQNH